jgi:hypothetical protein
MSDLALRFPSLGIFSNINWGQVAAEYLPFQEKISFPEYLQIKAENGDCPEYLFELAFYEMAVAQVQEAAFVTPEGKGLHLNPTAAFLNLDFDIGRMLAAAEEGSVEVHQRENVLCVFQYQDEVSVVELDAETLEFLEELEAGPIPLEEGPEDGLQELIELGLIYSITK